MFTDVYWKLIPSSCCVQTLVTRARSLESSAQSDGCVASNRACGVPDVGRFGSVLSSPPVRKLLHAPIVPAIASTPRSANLLAVFTLGLLDYLLSPIETTIERVCGLLK